MNKNQFLRSLREVYCRLAPTEHGVGVVAIRPIDKGMDPFKNCDPYGTTIPIPEAEFDACDAPEEVKEMVRDFCALQDGNYYVPSYGLDAIDKSFYLNHSKTPNMVTNDDGETFVAARDIAAGEELTADYNTYHEYQKAFRREEYLAS